MKKQINAKFVLATITTLFLLGACGSTFAQNRGAITKQEIKDSIVERWTHNCDKATIAV